eukprot:336554_1
MTLDFALVDTFCVTYYWLLAYATCSIIVTHILFRRTQKIHYVLIKIQQLDSLTITAKDREDQYLELLEQYSLSFAVSQTYQTGLSNLKTDIQQMICVRIPLDIIDVIISYCYSTQSHAIHMYYHITKHEMVHIIERKLKKWSILIELYCYVRIVFIVATYVILIYKFIVWHHSRHPNLVNGSLGYILVMIYHPLYKGTIIRVWSAYNGSHLYLPKIVRVSICIEVFIFFCVEIVHIVELLVSVVVFIPFTIGLILYYLIHRRIEQSNPCKKHRKLRWISLEMLYFWNTCASWCIMYFSLWVYTISVVPFIKKEKNWTQSFLYTITGEYCQHYTMDTNDWSIKMLFVTWIFF